MRSAAPYGTWSSPLRAARIAAGGRRIGSPRFWRGEPCWLESRPEQGGRVALMGWRGGAARELTPEGANVRSRVHEYGGGELGCAGDALVYVDFAKPGIQRLGGEPVPATLAGARYVDFAGSPDGRFLLAVEEEHGAGAREPANRLVAFDLLRGRRIVALDGFDFVSSPRFSPDGRRAACLAWNHPRMPWLGTELLLLPWDADGPAGAARRVAGGPAESLFQPEFAPDGRLLVVSDRSGWWNLYRLGEDGALRCVHARAAEFGAAQWGLGMSCYDVVSASEALCAFAASGSQRLARLGLDTGRLEPLALPWCDFEGVRVDRASGRALFVAAGPRSAAALVSLDLASGRWQELARACDDALDPDEIASPEAIRFPSAGGREAHAFLYRPKSARFEGPAAEQPPLVVKSHGGPTGCTSPSLRLAHQFWTSRGFAVVDVNYGGSTGYGRAYRDLLHENWGVVDVEDCANAALFLAREGIVDAALLVASGGSAGGYTTLCLLTFRDEFAAGASHYGIGDLAALARHTHKFEAHYTDWLVGPWPAASARYRERSPIHHTDRLRRPVIFFQGLEDRVVPPAQAEAMAAALAARGVRHAIVRFPGEGHGFRRAEHIQRALEAELWFYGEVLGFPVDSTPAPVPVLRGALAAPGPR
jgi:dipeptidyl aminopeptidase/acylaminoacyl peptidase